MCVGGGGGGGGGTFTFYSYVVLGNTHTHTRTLWLQVSPADNLSKEFGPRLDKISRYQNA